MIENQVIKGGVLPIKILLLMVVCEIGDVLGKKVIEELVEYIHMSLDCFIIF